MNYIFSLVLLLLGQFTVAQEVFELYDQRPQGSEDWNWEEAISTDNLFNTKVVYNVSEPTITAYLPPYYLATGTAVIIAPGGGFHVLSIDSEGHDVAKWLQSKGVAAFVLKYRLVRSLTDDPVQELMNKIGDREKLNQANARVIPLAMADGHAAVKFVRERAREFDINPDKVGFMGFSAGAVLAMSVVYNGSEANTPDFVAPIYGAASGVIGSEIPEKETPLFIAVAADDQLGLMPDSWSLYKEWTDAGQPAEIHIYERGGHGFGMRKQSLPSDQWIERFGDWMHMHGYLKKLYPNKYEKIYGQDAVAQGKIDQLIKMQTDYADLARYARANEALPPPKANEQRIVFLGNSITDAWPNIDPDFFEKNNLIGRGISGQTSVQLLLRYRQDVINLDPAAVVIHIGTNDVAENTGPYDPEYTIGNIRSMIELAQKHEILPILASVLPATKFEWNRALGDRSDQIVALNKQIKMLSEHYSIPYIDYHTALTNEKNGMDPAIAPDGVHPSQEGYALMKKVALETLQSLLKM